jgi:type III secretion protein O
MEVIDGLLRIKRIRENSREADMRRAKQQFELAAEALRRASELQEQRDRERSDRERSLYHDVCTRIVIVRDLDDLRYEVDVMKDAAKADAQAVVDARTQRLARRQAFDESAGAWRLAARATQKFEDLSAQEREATARHAEWMADLELEEHPSRSVLAEAMEESTQEA